MQFTEQERAPAVEHLHENNYDAVVMDLFIPLGDHPHRVLGPRARRYQEQVEHLGGLVLLEELDRLPEDARPIVISHTACTDHVLLEIVLSIAAPFNYITVLSTWENAAERVSEYVSERESEQPPVLID